MNKILLDQAIRLASRHYVRRVILDETTSGDPIYLASNPDLEGCLAQGTTPDEAIQNLEQARVDFIYCLLEDHLHVPEPTNLMTITQPILTQGVSEVNIYELFGNNYLTVFTPNQTNKIPVESTLQASHQ